MSESKSTLDDLLETAPQQLREISRTMMGMIETDCKNIFEIARLDKNKLDYNKVVKMADSCKKSHFLLCQTSTVDVFDIALENTISWLQQATIDSDKKHKLLTDIMLTRIHPATHHRILYMAYRDFDDPQTQITQSFHNASKHYNIFYSEVISPSKYSNSFGLIMKATSIFFLCRIAVYYSRNIKSMKKILKFRLRFAKFLKQCFKHCNAMELMQIGRLNVFHSTRAFMLYIQGINKIIFQSEKCSYNQKQYHIKQCLKYVEIAWKYIHSEFQWWLEKIQICKISNVCYFTQPELILAMHIKISDLVQHEAYLYELSADINHKILDKHKLRINILCQRLFKFPSNIRQKIMSIAVNCIEIIPIHNIEALEQYVANKQTSGNIIFKFTANRRDIRWMRYWLFNKQCSWCFVQTRKLYICSGCKQSWYCSRYHQKLDWNSKHRFKCSLVRDKL